MNTTLDFKALTDRFLFDGEFFYSEPFGYGHINDTYAVYFKNEFEPPCRYILQRINHKIFKHPEKLMENIENVTTHIRWKIIASGGNNLREVLTIIKTKDGKNFHVDESGNFWRAYIFIENATSFQQVEKPEQFYEAARAFGYFQKQLCDFPADTLYETIPCFHHTEKRFETFVQAVFENKASRADTVKAEIAFAMQRKNDASVIVRLLKDKRLPLRVTHNDTKLNNVMIDNATGKGICVIDLDTVMPGSALYDFGDSIRFGASTAAEDETDLSKVEMELRLFELYTKGYLEEAGESLTDIERDYLPFGAKMMTFECGIRFLTDYLNGDNYFKIHREHHNLDRCRTQFKLVADMESKMDHMQKIVRKYK